MEELIEKLVVVYSSIEPYESEETIREELTEYLKDGYIVEAFKGFVDDMIKFLNIRMEGNEVGKKIAQD